MSVNPTRPLIVNKLREIQRVKGIKQEALAAAAGMSLRSLERVFSGEKTPSEDEIGNFAKALKCTLEALTYSSSDIVKEVDGMRAQDSLFAFDAVPESTPRECIAVVRLQHYNAAVVEKERARDRWGEYYPESGVYPFLRENEGVEIREATPAEAQKWKDYALQEKSQGSESSYDPDVPFELIIRDPVRC